MIFIVAAFLLTRILNLTLLPVFTDEANYIDWGWRSLNIPHHLFYSLYDGKQPLMVWIWGLSQKIFSDPLFAGRIVSVFTGLLTVWGLYSLAKYLYDKNTAINACILYTFIPLFLLFDRQALMESALSAIGVWSLFFLIKYLHENKYKFLIALGVILGLGFFIKSSALLFIASAIVILTTRLKLNSVIPILTLLICIGLVCFPLFMQPGFWSTLSLNSRYSAGLFGPWIANFSAIPEIMFWQLTPLIYLAVMLAIYKAKDKTLLLWTFVPLVLSGLTATYMISRYVVPFLPPLLILIARVNRKILFLAVMPALTLSIIQIAHPRQYFYLLSKVSKYSYIEGYVTHEASGYMTQVAVDRIKELAHDKPIALGIGLFSGNPEVGLLIYFRPDPNVLPAYLDAQLFPAKYLDDYDCLQFDRPLYLASRASNKAGLAKFFDDFELLTNSASNSKVYLSKLKENCRGKTLSLTLQRE